MPKLPPLNRANFPSNQLTPVPLPGADVYYQPNLFTDGIATHYFEELSKLPGWEARPIVVYSKPCYQNRQTIFFGEKDTNYRYSGIDNKGGGDIPLVLREITERVETMLREQGLLTGGDNISIIGSVTGMWMVLIILVCIVTMNEDW